MRPYGTKPRVKRSPKWPKVEKAHLKEFPHCAVCKHKEKCQVHHKRPYHLFPELELDPDNLITLCEIPGSNHHLWWGHLGNWKSYNPDVVNDAEVWRKKIEDRPDGGGCEN